MYINTFQNSSQRSQVPGYNPSYPYCSPQPSVGAGSVIISLLYPRRSFTKTARCSSTRCKTGRSGLDLRARCVVSQAGYTTSFGAMSMKFPFTVVPLSPYVGRDFRKGYITRTTDVVFVILGKMLLECGSTSRTMLARSMDGPLSDGSNKQ